MAGTLVIDTLKASTGVLATQNGMSGICKAWLNYNAVAQTVTGSFNVSSVTYNSTGTIVITFTTAMPDATYAVAASAIGGGNDSVYGNFIACGNLGTGGNTASVLNVQSRFYNGTAQNPYAISVAVFR